MNIGILTGGGDCPGLNAVIRAVVRKSIGYGHKVFGIKRGWKGLLDKDVEELTLDCMYSLIRMKGPITHANSSP